MVGLSKVTRPKVLTAKASYQDLGPIKDWVKASGFKNQKILVKPNMLGPNPPEEAATTHPTVVRAVVEQLLDQGCEVRLGDSPATYPTPLKVLLEKTGIGPALEGLDVEWAEIDKLPPVKIKLQGLTKLETMVVSEALAEVDGVVSLSKFKTHSLTAFTGAVKNFYGVVPRKAKKQYHAKLTNPAHFSAMIVDLTLTLAKKLDMFHIMDAVVGMEGDGPKGGDPVEIGMLLGGDSPFKVDDAALSMVRPPIKAYTNELARELGLLDKYVVDGPVEKFSIKKPRGYHFVRLASIFPNLSFVSNLIAVPEINDSCTGCGTCVRNCPVDAITIRDGKAHIDRDKCIKCFTCAEVCPVNAVEVQRRLFNR